MGLNAILGAQVNRAAVKWKYTSSPLLLNMCRTHSLPLFAVSPTVAPAVAPAVALTPILMALELLLPPITRLVGSQPGGREEAKPSHSEQSLVEIQTVNLNNTNKAKG